MSEGKKKPAHHVWIRGQESVLLVFYGQHTSMATMTAPIPAITLSVSMVTSPYSRIPPGTARYR